MKINALPELLIVIVVLCIMSMPMKAQADLPLEELWSVELDSATALGNAWLDDDGEFNVLVGDEWQAKLIVDDEVQWHSNSLAGDITALSWIPFDEGSLIIVSASERMPEEWNMERLAFGWIYRFNADDHELQDSTNPFEAFDVPD